jgi:hypothetical protein
LDAYAKHFDIEARLNERVTRAEQSKGRWLVTTERERYSAESLIITTGLSRVPHRPTVPGEVDFGGAISHASSYANPSAFEGKRVLVVGFGNSGAEIALDLAERGVNVSVAVRSPCNVIPRKLMEIPPGVPRSVFAWVARHLPRSWLDAYMRLVARLALGDLSTYGIQPLPYGVTTGLARGKVPVIDVGTITAIKRGRITVYPNLSHLTADGASFSDGRSAPFDHILLATGYRTGLQQLFPDPNQVLDEAGLPLVIGRESALHRLYFVGFEVRLLGLLYTTMLDARAVVDELTRNA